MNTKTFAQTARTILREGVASKLLYWGFDEDGTVLEEPQKIEGGYLLRGEPYDDPNVPELWKALKTAIQKKGIEEIVEEAAYTWFNRIMAIRILAKNGYDEPLLDNVEGMEHTPIILQKARQGKYDYLGDKEQKRLKKIINDYSKDQDAFALLLIEYCHQHNTLNRVFGKLEDYTEILLPDNTLQDSGFLHLLNTTDAISDEDYQKVELIGWLYQFYISERKDEVFASFKKNKKAEAKDIPAATQIFTPNWIVKYMVENTAGKIWLDKKPNSALKAKMKYLVENDSDGKSAPIINSVEELTLIDPACGSGHILVEGFDLLFQMYEEEYYPAEEAVESIFKNNLFGLDIDVRAAQLATFAILLKAAKVYPDVWKKDYLPQVHAMPEEMDFSQQEVLDFLGKEGKNYLEELSDALRLMKQAKNLGSVMKFDLSETARSFIKQRFEDLKNSDYREFNVEAVFQGIRHYIPVLLLLNRKYTSVVANPPYMHRSNMNLTLKNYVFQFYPKSKTDLFAVFMERLNEYALERGLISAINQQSWMFISSYDELRQDILKNYTIDSLIHLGLHVFKELNSKIVQSVVFVLKKKAPSNSEGIFLDVRDSFSLEEKERQFKIRGLKYNQSQVDFLKIPGYTIAYWVSKSGYEIFKNPSISDISTIFQGMITGDNKNFVRSWFEVNYNLINIEVHKFEIDKFKEKYWVGYSKGGESVKWYGNQEHIVNFKENGKNFTRGKAQFRDYYFKEYVTWSYISLSLVSRYFPSGFIWDVAGSGLFPNEAKYIKFVTSLLTSKVGNYILGILNPTLNFQVENIAAVPIVIPDKQVLEEIDFIAEQCISLTKKVYDSYEVSRDFLVSDFIGTNNSLKEAVLKKEHFINQTFYEIHKNEEASNKILIDLYGLNDDLNYKVDIKNITTFGDELHKADLIKLNSDENHLKNGQRLPVKLGELVSQFISYAIGLFMGRYRLDKKGLNIAHPNPTAEELSSYHYNNGKVIIDEDAIVPLMGSNCQFPDDALNQFSTLLDTIWGSETRTANINFIQDALNKEVEQFLVKDFYKYHCSMYKKKPIYWLFSSPKGAFQVLVYMHRMNEFTVEKIRANYLLEHLKNLRSEESMLKNNVSNLSTQEAKRLDQIQKDILECETYDMELKTIADAQIKFDLDDGVTENYKLFESVLAKIK